MAANKQIQPWQANLIKELPARAQHAVRMLFNAIQDHDTAIVGLDAKVAALSPSSSTSGGSSSSPSSSSSSTTPSTVGLVNIQTGTSYTTVASDDGGLLVLNNAAPVTVFLTSTVTPPWFMAFLNMGGDIVTFQPQTGNINSVASVELTPNCGGILYFDSVNFWAIIIPISAKTKTTVAHQWLNSYDAATGLFTASQPAFSDISGTASTGQIPNLPQSQITGLVAALAALAPSASPTFSGTVTQPDAPVLTAPTTATSATAGAATDLPATPAGYLEISLGGTTYKIPYYAV